MPAHGPNGRGAAATAPGADLSQGEEAPGGGSATVTVAAGAEHHRDGGRCSGAEGPTADGILWYDCSISLLFLCRGTCTHIVSYHTIGSLGPIGSWEYRIKGINLTLLS